jgi:hypothetical protein
MQGPTKPRGHINFDTSFLLASLQGCLSHLHQKIMYHAIILLQNPKLTSTLFSHFGKFSSLSFP